MEVIAAAAGDLEVDHQVHAGDVQPPGGHVRGHQEADAAVAQQVQHPDTFRLLQFAMEDRRPVPLADQVIAQGRRLVAGIAEDQDLVG